MLREMSDFVMLYKLSHNEESISKDVNRFLDMVLASAKELDKHPGRMDIHARICSILGEIALIDKEWETNEVREKLVNLIDSRKYPRTIQREFVKRASKRFTKLCDILCEAGDKMDNYYSDKINEYLDVIETYLIGGRSNNQEIILEMSKLYYQVQWDLLRKLRVLLSEIMNDETKVVVQEAYDKSAKLISNWR